MKISHFDFSEPFELKNNFGILIVENSQKLYEYCCDFLSLQNNDEGDFIISDNNKELSFKKNAYIVFDFFNLSMQDKKIIAGLYSELSKIVDEKYPSEQWEICCKITNLMDKLSLECDYPIEHSEQIFFTDFLKLLKVQPLSIYDSFLEKITNYIDAVASFADIKLLIFVGLRMFLSKEDMLSLIKHVAYSSVNVLMIEKIQPQRLNDETMLIIDKDLCEILVK